MGLEGKKVFVRKSCGANLYKWGVQSSLTDPKMKVTSNGNVKTTPESCSAVAYQDNGNDSVNKYVSTPVRINGNIIYDAYVECDYVE